MTACEASEPTQGELFSLPDGPVKGTQWRAVVGAWLTNGPGSGQRSPASWLSSVPPGSSARTSLAYYPSPADGISPPSSGTWPASGMGSPGGFWTLDTSESPNGAVASSLSDILETTGEHLHRYSLSPKAAAGILRRASRRGRSLPAALEAALAVVASHQR